MARVYVASFSNSAVSGGVVIDSPLLSKFQGFIDNRWLNADSGETIDVLNPSTGALLAKVPNMSAGEAERAVTTARRHLRTSIPADTRRDWLQSIYDFLMQNREELGRIITFEHGKPIQQAIAEVEYSAGFFKHYAHILNELDPQILATRAKHCEWTVYARPIGVVGLITPWNFPLAMFAKKFSAAIAADCVALVKPSSKTPLTMIAFFELLQSVLPACAERQQLLIGSASEIADALCESSRVDMISFTGSTEVGRHLIHKSAQQVKKLALELGGNAPYIVFGDADLEASVKGLIANKFRGSGQTCVCANRVLVHHSVLNRFSQILRNALGDLKVGDGFDEVDVGPLIDRSGYDKVRRHLVDALERGANLAYGSDPGTLLKDWGAFFPPVMLTNVSADMSCVKEEVFGPLIPIMSFEDEREAINLANDTRAGLSAYVFTKDEERIKRILPALHFGHVGVNSGAGPTPEAPFGGMKHSGIGREGGVEGLFEYVELQTVAKA